MSEHRKNNSVVANPCVRSCCLDQYDICLGCGRSIHEITGWNVTNDEQKKIILSRAKQRLEQFKSR